jgi:hypothetical protein
LSLNSQSQVKPKHVFKTAENISNSLKNLTQHKIQKKDINQQASITVKVIFNKLREKIE